MRPALLFVVLSGLLVAVPAWADTTPPTIVHVPVERATVGGKITLEINLVDESEIFPPVVWYRLSGASKWLMAAVKGHRGRFEATLAVKSDIEYWIEAYDEFGNGPSTNGTSKKPHHINALAKSVAKAAPKPVEPVAPQDAEPPELLHVPLAQVASDEPPVITATIRDPSGVFAPTVHHRAVGDARWVSVVMEGQGDAYSVTLEVAPPFEYWLEAYDELGNGPVLSASAQAPYRVTPTQAAPQSLPAPVLATLPPAPSDEESGTPRRWWVGGAVGVAGAAIAGGIALYALTSGPDYGAWMVTQPNRR